MAFETYIYDSDQGSFSFGDLLITSGFSDGAFLQIVNDADAFSKRVGTSGTVTRSKTNNKTATLTLTLEQGAIENDYLSEIHNADLLAPNGAGVAWVQWRDGSGRSLFRGQGWIRKAPDAEYAREAGSRAWVFDISSIQRFDRGNFRVL